MLIYKKYTRSLGQSDFDLRADNTNAEIIIILIRSIDFFGR